MIILAASTMAACSESTPSEDTLPETSDAKAPAQLDGSPNEADVSADANCAPPAPFGSPKCNACAQENCCALIELCKADAMCRARMNCALPCLDMPDGGGCADTCATRYPDDARKWTAVETCAYFTDPCAADCLPTQ